MIEYKSSLYVILKNIVYGIFGGAAVGLIAFFIAMVVVGDASSTVLLIGGGLGVLVGLWMIYSAVYGNNYKIRIENNAISFYRGKKELRILIQ